MEPSEIEFLAENVRVSIVPNFNEGALFLMEGDVGPFRAGMPTSVPLWMAADLRSRKKCRIVQPVFLNPEKLEEVRLNGEKVAPATLGLYYYICRSETRSATLSFSRRCPIRSSS